MIELTTSLLITALWSYAFYRIGYLARRVDEEVEKAEFRLELWTRLRDKIAEEKIATLEDKAEKENNDGN